jgi:hypothetical protein
MIFPFSGLRRSEKSRLKPKPLPELNDLSPIEGNTSCAAKPFYIAKLNLRKTTFIDLGDKTLLWMTL